MCVSLIKGFEAPKKCCDCPFRKVILDGIIIKNWCNLLNKVASLENDPKPKDCPIITVTSNVFDAIGRQEVIDTIDEWKGIYTESNHKQTAEDLIHVRNSIRQLSPVVPKKNRTRTSEGDENG